MNNLITEYDNFTDESLAKNLWGSTVCQGNWKFGQKSDDNTKYPMWFQGFYNTQAQEYIVNNEYVKEVGNRFLEICGSDYTLIRSMLSGNTFGQDGDIHTDWPNLNESITGVLYISPRWQDSYGGETLVYDKNNTNYCEISNYKLGKLSIFDGANPHIGKGPQRECGELRCIIAVQALKTDAWNKFLDSKRKK